MIKKKNEKKMMIIKQEIEIYGISELSVYSMFYIFCTIDQHDKNLKFEIN